MSIEVYESREKAWLELLTSDIKAGKLYIRHYKNQEDKIDILVAYSTSDCNGYPESLDSLHIISGDSPFPVYDIVDYQPDVSELAKGQIYLWKDSDTNKLVYLEKDSEGIYRKKVVEFGEVERRVYSLRQGKTYFISNSTFRELSDYYTRDEVDSIISSEIKENIGDGLAELQQAVFPLSLSFSITPTIAEKGTTINVRPTYSVRRKGKVITDDCEIKVEDGSGNPYEIEDGLIKGISKTTTFKMSADYAPGYNTSAQAVISFVNRSYWGIVNKSIFDPGKIIRSLNSDLRLKGTLTYSGINLDLNQTIVYIYPAEYGNLSSIKDANGFEYITDYAKTEYSLGGVSYNIYVKITPTIITGFKQIYSF